MTLEEYKDKLAFLAEVRVRQARSESKLERLSELLDRLRKI